MNFSNSPINETAKTTTGKGSGQKPFFQPKLSINEPGDAYEHEADAMADKVMRMADTPVNEHAFFKPASKPIQRKCTACDEAEKQVQRKEGEGNEMQEDSGLDSYVSSLSSSGRPMSQSSRSFFEPKFGHDFSNVRLHTDAAAAKSAQSINALAYTTGNNIVFNNGQFAPESDSGKKLMAHELTHVVQQSNNIQPYRPKTAFNFGKNDTATLHEDSFDMAKDKETKPWIELITVTLEKQQADTDGNNFWVGKAHAKYYNDKLPAIDFTIAAGSPELGKTTAGSFTVIRIEGVGYNSGTHSGKVDFKNREGPSKRYSKDLVANMHFAVFFHGGEALHSGPADASSHGCVHVSDWGVIQQINYHSVLHQTKVIVSYPPMGDFPVTEEFKHTA